MRTLLCGIGKLENRYIREWVEYHFDMGLTNIVLYDNNDIDGEHFEDVIGDYIKSGYVILKNWRGRKLAQIPAYNSCYNEYKGQYDWIGFWDIDEFLVLEKEKTIDEFLSKDVFKNRQSIRICWKQYTDNGLVKSNGDYSVTKFTEVFDKNFCTKNGIPIANYYNSNTQSKAILRTNIDNINITSPHVHSVTKTVVDATGKPCKDGIKMGNTPVWKGAWLNHYRFKTIEEFIEQKMVRLWPTAYKGGGRGYINTDFFFQYNKKTNEKVELAKKLLENKQEPNIKRVNSWVKFNKNETLFSNNWGDDINFTFLSSIFDADLCYNDSGDTEENYCLIGSILDNRYVNKNSVIWGSGTQDASIKLTTKPKKVLAVRGPLTRKYLISQGIDCPEIYGDPSVLLPYFYKPEMKKKYKIGLIPHWESLGSPIVKEMCEDSRVHLIKMKGYNYWTDVIDEILSCEYIVSESLHGLIVAETYGIPNLWCNITLNKYNVKFHDYFQSIGVDRKNPFHIKGGVVVEDLLEALQYYKKGEKIDVEKLMSVCPFKLKGGVDISQPSEEIKQKIVIKKEEKPRIIPAKKISVKSLKKRTTVGKRYTYTNVTMF